MINNKIHEKSETISNYSRKNFIHLWKLLINLMAYKMLILALILGAYAGFFDIRYGDFLGPYAISDTISWHASRIVLDSNHKDSLTTLYVFFNMNYYPYGLDPSTNTVEISIPGEDSLISCELYIINNDIRDYAAICPFTTDTEGSYGPVSLWVRVSETGQILAQETTVGYFYVLEDEPTVDETGLTVEYVLEEGVETTSVYEEVSLNFSFTLYTSESLYPGDYIILIGDESFSHIEDNFELVWGGELEGSDLVENTDDNFDEETSEFYIFGFDQGLSGTDEGFVVNFVLHGMVNSYYANNGGVYEFDLKIMRYGTPTIYKHIKGTGPSTQVVAGEVNVDGWYLMNTNFDQYIAEGLLAYSGIVFSLEYGIEENDTVSISVTNAKFCDYYFETDSEQTPDDAPGTGDYEDCSIIGMSDEGYLICTVTDSDSSSTLDCVPENYISGGVTIYILGLTTFLSTSPTVTSIVHKDPDDNVIHSLSSTYTLSKTEATLLTVNQLYIAESSASTTGKNSVGLGGSFGLVVAFDAPVDLVIGDTFTIYGPFSKDTSRNEEYVAMTSTFYALYETGDGVSFDSAGAMESASTSTSNKISISDGSIEFTLEEAVTSGNGIVFFVGAGTKDANSNIYLPLVVTVLGDFSDIALVLQKGEATYIYSTPFYFGVNTEDFVVDVVPFCNNVIVDGLPFYHSMMLPYDFNVGDGVVVYIEYDNDLLENSELVEGVVFSSINADPVFTEDGKLRLVLDSVNEDEVVWFVCGLPKFDADIEITVSLYELRSEEEALAFETTITVYKSDTEFSYTSASDGTIDLQETQSITFTVPAGDHDGTDATSSTVRYAYILPKGFAFDSTTMNLIGSESQYYIYKSAYSSKTLTEASSQDFTVKITGPWYELSDTQDVVFAVALGEDFANDECIIGIKKSFTVSSAPRLSYKSYYPTSLKAYTYGSIYTIVWLELEYSGYIYPGMYLTFVIGSEWEYVEYDAGFYISDDKVTGEYDSDTKTWTSSICEDFYESGTITLFYYSILPKVTSSDVSDYDEVAGFTSVTIYYLDSDTSIPAYAWVQSEDDTDNKATSEFSAGSTTPSSSDAEISVFPNVVGSKQVFFGATFTAPQTIPSGSLIMIDAGFLADSEASSNTWCSYGFSSVSISGGVLTLTNAAEISSGDDVTIVKDLALDLSESGINQVLISVSVDGENVIDDSYDSSDDSDQGFTVYDEPTNQLETLSMNEELTNAGFYNWYQFTFSLTESVSNGLFIHFHTSKDYNSYSGPVYTFDDLPGELYLEAYFVDSSDLYFLVCRTEHWVTSCYIGDSLSASSEVQFIIYLKNPSVTGYANVYFTDYDGSVIAIPNYDSQEDPSIFVSEYTGEMDLYYAEAEYSEDTKGVTHTVTLYSKLELTDLEDATIVVQFPEIYSLDQTDPVSTSCRIQYLGASTVTLSTSAQCEIDKNLILFDISSSIDSDFTLDPSYWTVITIEGIVTPEYGVERDPEIYEPDDIPDFSSRNFVIGKVDSVDDYTSQINSISFENLNAAFASFYYSSYLRLEVNNGDHLIIVPGTFSGEYYVYPQYYELYAYSVTLVGTPRSDSSLVLSNEGVFELSNVKPYASFWVGISSDSITGFYYIDWAIQEDPYGDSELYSEPPPTLVQVNNEITYNLVQLYDIYVPPGYPSFPYPIFIESTDRSVTPYEYIDITFSHDYANLSIIFYPSTITLITLYPFASVSIECLNCEYGETYEFYASISGPDAAAFNFDQTLNFLYDRPYENNAVVELSVNDVTTNSFSIDIDSDSFALLTWCLVGEYIYNEEIISETFLLENVYGYGSVDSNKSSVVEQIEDYFDFLFTLLDEADSYSDYALLAIWFGRSVYLTSQELMLPGETFNIDEFTNLVPDSNYFFIAYVDNFNGNGSTLVSTVITTDSLPPHGVITLETYVDEDELIAYLVSELNIDPIRIIFDAFGRRRLDNSQEVIVLSSVTDTTSGYSLATSADSTKLASSLGTSVVSVESLTPDSVEDGGWASEPEWDLSGDILYIMFEANTTGKIYCEVEENPDLTVDITSDQVLSGMDRFNGDNSNNSYSGVVDTFNITEFQVNFTGYSVNVYQVSCIVCNSYPVTPECSSVRNQTVDLSQDSGAIGAVVALAILLFS